MSTERDELIQMIWDDAVADRVRGGKSPQTVPVVRPKVEAMADRIVAAGYRKPRIITTAEELDALELRSIVRDSDSEPFELTDNGWRYWLYEESFSSFEMSLPATVLYEPEAQK